MLEKTHTSRPDLADVLDRVLDKGIVIDAVSYVSIAGAELVTVYSHMVVASIETYLKYFAEDVANARPGHRKARVVEFPALLPD